MDNQGLIFLKGECDIILKTMGVNSSDPVAQNARRFSILVDAILAIINGGSNEQINFRNLGDDLFAVVGVRNEGNSERSSKTD